VGVAVDGHALVFGVGGCAALGETQCRIDDVLGAGLIQCGPGSFDQFGKEAGLEKKSGSWYGRSDEVISISNLQKSQYGPQYYFNQAFWLRQLGDERFPKENKSHIRARLGSLLPPAGPFCLMSMTRVSGW
jgi:hypothetical protein